MHVEQIRIYRSMTPDQKYQVFLSLYRTARQLKAAGLKLRHPDWDEKQIEAEVKRIFTHATT
jgi:hypothetical protein